MRRVEKCWIREIGAKEIGKRRWRRRMVNGKKSKNKIRRITGSG